MRTDSKTYSKEFLDIANKYIEMSYGIDFINKNILNLANEQKKIKKDKKYTRCTWSNKTPNLNITDIDKTFDNKEIRMYKLIWKNTVQSCMEPSIYTIITFKITAPLDLIYKFIGEECLFLGWQLLNDSHKDDKKEIAYNYLPKIKNKKVNFSKITSKVTIKDLKMHYTEARLVQLLEEKGIGRPSTFSSLIDKIQEKLCQERKCRR